VRVPLNDCNGSVGMNTSKSLSLRENADTTKRASAPPADAMMKAKNVPLRGIADSTKPESAPPAKTNPETGDVYSGRTSGTGTPEQNVAARDASHHMNEDGYGPAQLDKSSTNPDAIRGREQQLIDQNGGAQSQGGTSGNRINGVSPNNPKAGQYEGAAQEEFGAPEEPFAPEIPEPEIAPELPFTEFPFIF